MNWRNLQLNKCPKCDKLWAYDIQQKGHLLIHSCGFAISERRYAQIVNSQVTQALQDKWDQVVEGGEKNE